MSPRAIASLILAVFAATAGGIVLFQTLTHSESISAPEMPTWDADIEGYDVSLVENELTVTYDAQVAPLLVRHCADCHGMEKAEGGVNFDGMVDSGVWAKVAEVLRTGRMPPHGKPRPGVADLEAFNVWFNRMAMGFKSTPTTLRRLNRYEYNNTIRDLVGVTLTPADDFPADDTGDGFDTNADVLSISPILIEKYLIAAEAVVDAAAKNPTVWKRLINPPLEDFIPFVLRGNPPERAHAVKGQRFESADDSAIARAVEIDRTFYALQAFADRAFRRPVTHVEMARLMRFVETALANGDGVDGGFKMAMTAVLVSAHFLFRVEVDSPTGAGTNRLVTNFELATRLSYFLWSSMPDEELFRLAASGKLVDVRTLVGQVRRMLRDPKSRALAENFAGQWLQTGALAEATRDLTRFPEFDDDLRRAMRQETELFFDYVVRVNRSVLDLLTGEYTFVNDRLARHYGIAGVEGSHFRQVSLSGTNRAGVLTHASVLTITSGPTRTSPVKRGKWVLENVLGISPPSPPPGVDGLKDVGTEKVSTLREQLDRHRSRAECASCHSQMDPIGFGLENFDAVGAWRDRDGNTPVDASGILPNGQTFHGPRELIAILAEKPIDFVRCFTTKLLTYALGRSMRPADRSTVDLIARHTARNDYKITSLIIALVRCDLFQKRHVVVAERSP
jgi:hypothetical protein